MTTVTFDPATKPTNATFSNGDLTVTTGAPAGNRCSKASLFKSTGTWYCELTVTTEGNPGSTALGIATSAASPNAQLAIDTSGWGYFSNALKIHNGSNVAYGATFTDGDVISMLLDLTSSPATLTFWKNGATQGTAYNAGIAGPVTPAINQNWNSVATMNFGATAFAYTPTSGYIGWDSLDPSTGDGEGTLEQLTASGSRIAAGAGTMEELTATGGYNGIGAATLEYLAVSGAGGNPYGEGTLTALTGTGTGRQDHRGAGSLEALTADATGSDSTIITTSGEAPAPTLSCTVLSGEVITFAGTAPAPVLSIGTKDARLTAPAPTLVATVLTGTVITLAARAPVPTLVAINDNPAIITVAGSARVPVLVATLAAGQILTFSGSARPPVLSASSLTGNVATAVLEAATPILVAAGYPAFTITFVGTAPAPYMVSVLSGPASANYRTWALNFRKGALTEYDNFEFNSFATFNNQVLAAGSSGIVVLGAQDLDNTTAITARVRSGKDSFGSSVHKRVPRAYLGHTADGDLYFRMITTEGGTRTYLLGWAHAEGLVQRRIPIGKGPKSRYWQWEVENVAGADFDIDNVMLYPTKLRRRVQ